MQVVHSKDDERAGMAHEITSHKNQPEDNGTVLAKPKQASH